QPHPQVGMVSEPAGEGVREVEGQIVRRLAALQVHPHPTAHVVLGDLELALPVARWWFHGTARGVLHHSTDSRSRRCRSHTANTLRPGPSATTSVGNPSKTSSAADHTRVLGGTVPRRRWAARILARVSGEAFRPLWFISVWTLVGRGIPTFDAPNFA